MTVKITEIENAIIKNPTLQTTNNSSTFTLGLPQKNETLATTNDITTATSSLATQSALNSVIEDVDSLEERMNGVQQARVFNTVAEMNTWLASSTNTATLSVGTNLYIRALDVPDYWWDGTRACELETAKVDITNCATKTGNETLTNKTITNPILKDDSTSYTLTVPQLSSNTKIATAAQLSGYATVSHDHNSIYAAKSHTHSDYASTSHTHDDLYASKSHTHSEYASTSHTHSGYAATNHNHDNTYATKTHTHSEYISSNGCTLTNPTLKPSANSSYSLTVPSLSSDTTIATAADLTQYSKTNHTHSQYLTEHQSLSGCVKNTGDETIAGTKTFSAAPKFSTNTIARSNAAVIELPGAAGKLATLAGTEELTNKTIKNPKLRDNSTTYNLTVPTLSANAVIATETFVEGKGYLTSTSDCVKTTGNQTIAGTKTFSAAPKLSTNTIARSNGTALTLPDSGKIVSETSSPASSTNLMKAIINIIYPVGIVCFFHSTDKPDDKFPGTQWDILSTGKYVQTRDQTTASSTGGSSESGSTTLKLTDIPSHNHTATSTFTGTQATGTFPNMHSGERMNYDNTIFTHGSAGSKGYSGSTAKDTYVCTWTYTPAGSVSTTTGNAGDGGGHTHTINPPYITLSAWKRKS